MRFFNSESHCSIRLNLYQEITVLIIAFTFSLMATSVFADLEFLDSSRDIIKDPATVIEDPETFSVETLRTVTEQYRADAEDINNNKLSHTSFEQAPSDNSLKSEDGLVIFLSYSIPAAQLETIYEEGIRHNALFVIRGFPPGIKNFTEMVKYINDTTTYIEPKPRIVINPPLFQKYSIDSSPTQLVIKNGEAIAKVIGDTSPSFIISKSEGLTEYHDFGVKGNKWEIAERDLIEDMKSRMANINWQHKKENAIKNYWGDYDFIDIPLAIENKEYMVDPSILVTRNIYDPTTDRLLAKQGQKINPLAIMPMRSVILVFDGRDHKQQIWVKKQLESIGDRKAILIVNKFDLSNNFDGLFEMEQRFKRPVYVLNEALYKRLQLESLPSRVESTGHQLKITHYLLQ